MGVKLIRHTWVVAAAAVVAVAAIGTVAQPAAAGSNTWTYPSADCLTAPKGNLQQCIDDASPGDIVQIATDLVEEYVTIGKSLTLRGAPGYAPAIRGIFVYDDGSFVNANIENLRVTFDVSAHFDGSGGDVAVRNVTVDQQFERGTGISLSAPVAASLSVERSRIRVISHQASGISFYSTAPSGLSTFTAIGNRISQEGNAESGSGLEMIMDGAGSFRGDIMNNSVWDVARCNCGGSSGLFIYPQGLAQADVNVVGNTFELVDSNSIGLRNDLVPGGRLDLDVFNNVIAHSRLSGIYLDSSTDDSSLHYRGGYNDTFANGRRDRLEGHSSGPGNLAVNPRFVDRSTGDLRLKANSPVIDRGQVCSPGGVADPDAARKHRLAGASVDMGAFERGAVAPTGIVAVGAGAGETLDGTSGADIVCAMGGADLVFGKGGPDYLDGGKGPDLVVGGKGPDRLFGNRGDDTLCSRDGVGGNDVSDGGPGNDGHDSDPGDVRISVEYRGACVT